MSAARVFVLAGAGLVAATAVVAVMAWPRAAAVDLADVTSGPLTVTLDVDARTRMKNRVVLSAPVAGELVRPELRAGDRVEAGDVVARLEPAAAPLLDAAGRAELAAAVRTAEAAAAQARAGMARAEAGLQTAREQLARNERLQEGGGVARAVVDDTRAAVHALEHDNEVARFGARVAAEQVALARATQRRALGDAAGPLLELKAPMEGRVLAVLQEHGGVVAPGMPIIELGDPTSLEVVAPVLTVDALLVRAGASARIDMGEQHFTSRVRSIEPKAYTRISALGVEEQRTQVVIDLDPPPGEAPPVIAGDGWAVRAAITVWEATDVVQVPTGALFRDGTGWAVFAVEEGRARKRTVEIDHRAGGRAEVNRGLVAGARVILYPSAQVVDGARVKPR